MDMDILFNGNEHKQAFYTLLQKFRIDPDDFERLALVYALTITDDCRKHFEDCFDEKNRCGKWDALQQEWVTHSDLKAIRLALNLFSGDTSAGIHGWTPSEIFCDNGIFKYLIEAVKIRYLTFLNQ